MWGENGTIECCFSNHITAHLKDLRGIWRYQAKVVVAFCRGHVCDFGQESQGGFFKVH